MEVKKTIEIAAKPEKIWPLLVQPDSILKWCLTFKKFEYTAAQRSGMDTPFYVEEKAGGPLMKLNFVVTEWTQNQTLAFRMTSGSFVKGYEQRWRIEPMPSGSRFAFAENVKMPWGILGRLIGFFGRSGSEAHVKEMLARLKSLAEA
jgi:uncharacterized protein YndB with AHSA1/START domain